MSKQSKIEGFFKRKRHEPEPESAGTSIPVPLPNPNTEATVLENPPPKSARIDSNDDEIDIASLERDPGRRRQIWEYPVNKQDAVRRLYIKLGPNQPYLSKYPRSGAQNHLRSFQPTWYSLFPSWLEYSEEKDAAFCLPCYLFNKPSGLQGDKAFTIVGFRNWKKVRDGKDCAFSNHEGKHPNSKHKVAELSCSDLMNQSQHIQRVITSFSAQQIAENRLRVKTSIEAARWLAFQGCAFRGHDEKTSSLNPGNYKALLKLLGQYNEKVAAVILDRGPQNASYTSPPVQKQILQVFSNRARKAIREEIGDEKFCIIIDEARDESKREQMAIVLRFVDREGLIQEQFFGLVHVSDTAALTLQKGIYSTLAHHGLDIQNVRGQGYDGASNMRGQWNGLQALILKDCPYAYYIHCLAHRLQLALVTSSREVIPVHHFFNKLTAVVNIVGASCKRNDEFRKARAENIKYLISINEVEIGRGLNQAGNLKRAGDTRWGSHLGSVSSLIENFSATCEVLLNIINDGSTYLQVGDADAAYEGMTTFEFVFILHLMKECLEITDELCRALQCKSIDILRAMSLVESTKTLLQELRDAGCDHLLSKVNSFCKDRNIDLPNMSARYVGRKGKARGQQDNYTIEHHYKVDIFNAAIDSQLLELNSRFNENVVQLIVLSSALDPREICKSFRIEDVSELVDKFYPQDFEDQEKIRLKRQLQHFYNAVNRLQEFKDLLTISKMAEWMVKTRRSVTYHLVYKVVVLVLTFPVSTTTAERTFSAMKIVKTRLRNRMEDDFLTDSLIMYIEKEIVEKFSIDSIIDDFRDMQERRVPF